MNWTAKKLHHDTCIHLIRMGDGSWKECGVTITEIAGRPLGWLCPMHDRQVQSNRHATCVVASESVS